MIKGKKEIMNDIASSLKKKGWYIEFNKYGFDLYVKKRGIILTRKVLIEVYTKEVCKNDVIEVYEKGKSQVGAEIWIISTVGFKEDAKFEAKKLKALTLITMHPVKD